MSAIRFTDVHYPQVWTLGDVWTAAECTETVSRIERIGPDEAPINTRGGVARVAEVRNNARVIFDDIALAKHLFERVREWIPERVDNRWTVIGLNERFRGYRYEPGQYFRPHYDGAFRRSDGERSFITVMVYLNDDFEGGETAFSDLEQRVVPETGSLLLFRHRLLHEGCTVVSGTKYVLRTDVMYRRDAS